MNPTDQPISHIIEVITKGETGAVVLPANPTRDALAAASSLYLGLNKLGKQVSLLCAQSQQSDIVASDKIQTTFATKGDNLVISFPYADGSIDKVDYNIKNNQFNLIIVPRAGETKLDPSQVQFNYTGGSVDFIVTIDAPNLNALGDMYNNYKKEFDGKTIINIDRHLINNNFGMINYVDKTASSTSEMILGLLLQLKVQIDKEIATNLYTGLAAATNYFTAFSVTAKTFETAAELLKRGAIKKPPTQGGNTPFAQQPPAAQNVPQMNLQSPMQQPQAQVQTQPPAQNQQTSTPLPAQPQMVQPTTPQQSPSVSPQDWLKPKIFRGTPGNQG